MTLTSQAFVVFWMVALCAYNAVPARLRAGMLLAASCVFYVAGSAQHLPLLAGVAIAAFYGAKNIVGHPSLARLWLWLGMCLAPLVAFKVYPSLLHLAGWHRQVMNTGPPLGLSFFTFTAVAYIVDVYRGHIEPERRMSSIALHIAFFPKLMAGPIERAGRLLPQLAGSVPSSGRNLYVGFKWALWGLFCKLVVADNVGGVVDRLLASPDRESGATLWVAFILYAFQIYFDFFGYTCIAIGVARTFNVELSVNFERPYLATSIRDFWRRWHITLSTWFKDYVYIPLGGKYTRGPARLAHILSVFVLSGLWHGMSWTFVLWGSFHGVAYYLEERLSTILGGSPRQFKRVASVRVLAVLGTFLLVVVGWVFFRLSDVETVAAALGHMVGGGDVPFFFMNQSLFRADSLSFGVLLVSALVMDSSTRFRTALNGVPRSGTSIAQELAFVNWCAVTILLLGDLGVRDFTYLRF